MLIDLQVSTFLVSSISSGSVSSSYSLCFRSSILKNVTRRHFLQLRQVNFSSNIYGWVSNSVRCNICSFLPLVFLKVFFQYLPVYVILCLCFSLIRFSFFVFSDSVMFVLVFLSYVFCSICSIVFDLSRIIRIYSPANDAKLFDQSNWMPNFQKTQAFPIQTFCLNDPSVFFFCMFFIKNSS